MYDIRELGQHLADNDVIRWGTVLGIAALLTLAFKVIQPWSLKKMSAWASRTTTDADDLFVEAMGGTRAWVFFLWMFGIGANFLDMTAGASRALNFVLVFATGLQICIWGLRAIAHWRRTTLTRRVKNDTSSVAAVSLLTTVMQGAFVVLIVLSGLSHVGINIGALVAGLGVGGIAVGFALQNILGDLFASVAIVLDKPFVVGDFIVAGGDMGVVKNIGLKTTRVEALSGEEIIFPNRNLLESRVHNMRPQQRRRVQLKISVPYHTAEEKLRAIPGWLQEFVTAEPQFSFDHCNLGGLGASSLDYEFVFNVNSPDYNLYMRLQETLLLKIIAKFRAENVEFALPQQYLSLGMGRGTTEKLQGIFHDGHETNGGKPVIGSQAETHA